METGVKYCWFLWIFQLSCAFISLMTIEEANAFRCYVCDSKNDIECTENLPPNSRLIPRDCENIIDAKYCIKTTNIYAGEFGTKRFCAANDHGSYCKYIRQPTGDREYRSCVLTCDSEECNHSNLPFDKQGFFSLVTLLIVSSYFLVTRQHMIDLTA